VNIITKIENWLIDLLRKVLVPELDIVVRDLRATLKNIETDIDRYNEVLRMQISDLESNVKTHVTSVAASDRDA
jgi:hypothetical protein